MWGITWEDPFRAINERLDAIDSKLEQIMTNQADFDGDIQALTADLNAVVPFLAALPAQLAAIQQALTAQGVTDLSALDNLVTQANGVTGNVSSLNGTLSSLPGGTPAPSTPPPAPAAS